MLVMPFLLLSPYWYRTFIQTYSQGRIYL